MFALRTALLKALPRAKMLRCGEERTNAVVRTTNQFLGTILRNERFIIDIPLLELRVSDILQQARINRLIQRAITTDARRERFAALPCSLTSVNIW